MSKFTLRAGRRTGRAYQTGERVLTPESFVLEAGWPGGGFVWNWPIGLWVIDGSRTTHLRIVDVTRIAVWSFYCLALVLVLGGTLRSNDHG